MYTVLPRRALLLLLAQKSICLALARFLLLLGVLFRMRELVEIAHEQFVSSVAWRQAEHKRRVAVRAHVKMVIAELGTVRIRLTPRPR